MTDQKEKISNLISSDDVVLFMKGTPDFPQCGFSANVIGILNYFGVKFTSFNVLEDNELREGIKEFSDWPTIPQIYIKKEFIGGCDILRELAESGEIIELFKKKNLPIKINEQQ
ncbi:MAG: Grx4 family monothiol glutaredoxin [Alphaproteobacteria bacterium]|jgi:monothiol glutaredoxin|tara:strand:- start:79 stop:420 length:342 start_codon:yes stop_codon:yes gene_type:complete